MRQCPQCFRAYADAASFCLEDGTPLTSDRDSEATVIKRIPLSTVQLPTTKKKSQSALWAIVITALFAGVVLITLAIARIIYSPSEEKTEARQSFQSEPAPMPAPTTVRTPRPRPVPTPEEEPAYSPPPAAKPPPSIVPPYVELGPQGYAWYAIDAPSGALVDGQCEARGGMGNDLKVFIIPQSELVNFRNNQPFLQFYQSGQVHVAAISRALPPGAYYLILKSPTPFTNRQIFCSVQVSAN